MERKTGLEEYSILKNNRKLRYGYTTGSCAAAATKAAAMMLLGNCLLEETQILTPAGILLHLTILQIRKDAEGVSCAVRKDAGDDPDTTDGILVCSRVEKTDDREIRIIGGSGVGVVTLPGLSQKVGEPAINPVPRAMILQAAREAAKRYDYEGGLRVTISVPEGEEIAKKTFNSRMGIKGGISILGTTGIVEPMSEKAYLDSLRVEMRQHLVNGEEYLLMTPGNYGAEYLRNQGTLPISSIIKCGNFVGDTIDMAVELGIRGILFVSHIGKFVKVAGGIMNTHSHHADCRMEIIAAGAIRSGASLECARQILDCRTTDEALEILEHNRLRDTVMVRLTERIQYYLDHRSYEQIELGAVLFSNVYGFLGQTPHAETLIRRLI